MTKPPLFNRPKMPRWLRRLLMIVGVGTGACMKITTGTPQVICGVIGGVLAAAGVISKEPQK